MMKKYYLLEGIKGFISKTFLKRNNLIFLQSFESALNILQLLFI